MTTNSVDNHVEEHRDDDAIPFITDDIENTMNDGERERLLRYIDPEFLDASPGQTAKDADQVFEQERYDLEDPSEESELLDDFNDLPKETKMLAPRDYQYEIFQKAVEDNVLAVLDTGSGKTLIAVMLIKYIAAKEREERMSRRNTKLSFFLVDRVPLVPQQYNVIKANCDAKVVRMYGEMGIDKWSEKRWDQIFEENDVCVMTAQIFLDTLRHGFIHMSQVNLIIFDECHHATKRHPYNLIMKEHYQRCEKDQRPKIFGMTASPVHAKSKSVEESIFQLEANLDSRVYTTQNAHSISQAVNRPGEIIVTYSTQDQYEQTRLSKLVNQKIGHLERYKRIFLATSNACEQLGPWCCDRLLYHLLKAQNDRVYDETQELPMDRLNDEDRATRQAYEYTIGVAHDDPKLLDNSQFSGKIIQLMRILDIMRRKDDFCCIIFVERRHTAVAIDLLIKACHKFDMSVKSDILIGHGNNDDGDIQMRFKKQHQVIQRFRDGELNLLIATNVAEEGLDIQPCNVVIRFDFFNTLIAYIQSRGRARKPESKYIILVDDNAAGNQAMLHEFRRREMEMKQFCAEHPERSVRSRYNDDIDLDDDEDDEDEDDFIDRIYIVPNATATITLHHAVPLIHLYVSSLPSDGFCVLKPVFDMNPAGEGFTCTLRLPSNAAVREVTSEVARTKAKAKRFAAYDAAVQLHKIGALDDHLRPRSMKRQILGEMAPLLDENGQIIGSKRRRHIYEKRTPRFWERELPKEEEETEEQQQMKAEDDKDLMFAHTSSWRDAKANQFEPRSELSHVNQRLRKLQNTLTNGTTNPLSNGSTVGSDGHQDAQDPSTDPFAGLDSAFRKSLSTPTTTALTTTTTTTIATAAATTEASESQAEKQDDMDVDPEEDIGEGPFELHMATILIEITTDLANVRHMALVTWKPLPEIPDFELYNKGTPFKISFRPAPSTFQIDRPTLEGLAAFTVSITSAITNKDFQCPLIDYPYFFAPLKTNNSTQLEYPLASDTPMEAIDWDEIARIMVKEQPPVDLDNLQNDMTDTILMDYADNSRRYLVLQVHNDLTPNSPIPSDLKIRESGHENFAAYYAENFKLEVSRADQPMVRVKRILKVMNFLMPVAPAAPQEKKRTATFVVPEFCKVFWTSASVYQSAMFLPSIMTRLDSYLLIKEAGLRYDLPITDNLMLEAYTTPSASMAMNYERLETLGDSLLKFIATIRLYINFPFSDEGELHCLRIRVICNRALYRAAKRLRIYRYVTSHAFNRRYWRPHHFVSPNDNPETLKELRGHMLSDKTLADIVEASLGAAYLSAGLEGGLHTAIQMQIPFDEIKQWSDLQPTYINSRSKVPARAEIKALRSVSVPRVQEIAGYVFNTPLLIVEALTHASLPNSTAPCYQRLEFLGDAILDFLVIRYLYKTYPYADPGLITDIKDSCVNNHVLGIICVRNNLHTQIIHYSGRLVKAIEEFSLELETMEKNGEAVGEFWTEMSIPKVLSDVVESMLGAVFVDAGFDLAPVEKVFEKWMIPLYEKHVTPQTLKIHPLRKFTTDLQRMGCESFINHTTSSSAADSQKCVIFLHEKPLATGSADNVKAARRNAATRASQRLVDEPDLLAKICNCTITTRRKKREEEYDEDDI
ncbi:hypothetical protein BDB00DRAFT_928356 [Zychaea mexicana]|uniref:uncharacterized protein n=1 Tax=Zychaea mexicana TaxID=64656 RepID=UPI0022FEE2D5|nr:uncharacterized protein BDB00DRAFT_928356 [Zychaea mexicana]KAI9494240.1 hypothetical protein BDB00DRAFT_928356 [Zychaea mexicana]